MGRTIQCDEDCADCLCAVCARSVDSNIENPNLSYLDKDCYPCDNCYFGKELVEIEADCPIGGFVSEEIA